MPGMDGLATLALRVTGETARIPVILVTALAFSGLVAPYLARGALGVIAKPFSARVLVSEVARLLSRASRVSVIASPHLR